MHLLIVERGQPFTFRSLQTQYAHVKTIKVIWDRRWTRDRRKTSCPVFDEHRHTERRRPVPVSWVTAHHVVVPVEPRGESDRHALLQEDSDHVEHFVIRAATLDDAEQLSALIETFRGSGATVITVDRVREWLGPDTTRRLLVALDGRQIVGFASIACLPALEEPLPVGYITDVAVLPSLRGLGVGRHLLLAAEAYFRGLGLERMEVTSGPTHAGGHPFYRQLGYVDQGVRFAKRLTESRYPIGAKEPAGLAARD